MNLKQLYNESMINRLLIINIGVFLIISVFNLIMFLMGYSALSEILLTNYLGLPAALPRLVTKFWTPITYMFVHFEFWHLLGNMLWLYFMGILFLQIYDNKHTFAVYFFGGLSGALLYIISYNLFPVFNDAVSYASCVGASAAVTAIVIATCVARPNTEISIFGIIPLKLKWLGIIYVVYDILQIQGNNSGGHIAHIGGAIFGFLFIYFHSRGIDITKWFNKLIDKLVSKFSTKKKGNMHISYQNPNFNQYSNNKPSASDDYNNVENQKRVDEILKKISENGYNNLSKEEKDFLFKMSRNK